jgi:SPP1 gp7 family putative phage head morphogenesis protein
MSWDVSAEPGDFEEAVAWFRARLPMTDQEYEALSAAERTRAFWISGVNELRVVETVFDELERAIAEGLPIEEFEARVRAKLDAAHSIDGFHLETVFRNATQDAYNAGRYAQLTDPTITTTRPYWLFDAVLDARTTKTICRPLDGTIKAHDDPWWQTHHPQLHHRCRSGIRALRPSEAKKRGLTVGDPAVDPQPGFGLSPARRGTDLPEPDPEGVPPDLYAAYERRRRAAGE